jgi:hypothetical protein
MLDLYDALQAPEDDDTEFLEDPLADDDTHETAADDQRVTVNVPDNVTFESLVADSESLNSAGGIHFQVYAAVRLFHQNSLRRRAACPDSSLVKIEGICNNQ